VIEIRSAAPTEDQVKLRIAPLKTTVEVNETAILVDPTRLLYSSGRLDSHYRPHHLAAQGTRCRAGSTKATPSCIHAAASTRPSLCWMAFR
jgi:hypothetical protein